jgi:hypothetical protein
MPLGQNIRQVNHVKAAIYVRRDALFLYAGRPHRKLRIRHERRNK